MRSILAYFVRRHMLASLLTIMILLLGLNALRHLKRDIFPAVDFGQVNVQTTYPGASPQDVELNVTNPIEDELRNLSGIRQITSISLENLSTIEITLEPDLRDADKTKREIRNAVARVTDLPAEVTEAPLVLDIDTSLINICEVGIVGDLPYREKREIARRFERLLKDVPGVSRIVRNGWRAREIHIEVSPEEMRRQEIPLREIVQAIRARNIRLTAGSFESFTGERNVVTLAEFQEPTDVGDVIVRSTFDGPQIRIRDLALIHDDFEDPDTLTHLDGVDAISFEVYKREQADIVRTMDAVKKLIAEETDSGRLNGARLVLANDLSDPIRDRFSIVLSNGAFGLALVVLALSVFLALRTAFWVALGIPVAILGTIFLLPSFGLSLDTLTLTSLVLLIGIIVDDGIIISENIHRRREAGESPQQAAISGVQEVFTPVVGTVLTTLLAFAPLFFMTGIIGRFTRVIPLTVTVALLVSLLESSLALPSHLARSMERTRRRAGGEIVDGAAQAAEPASIRRWFGRLRSAYAAWFRRLLRFRWLLVGLFVLLFLTAMVYASANLKFILFPSRAAEQFYIGLELAQGTSLQATGERTAEVERIIQELPRGELKSILSRVGQSIMGVRGESYAYIMVALTPYNQRERSADEVIASLRPRVESLEGLDRAIFMVESGGPPVGKPISLRVIGNDDEARSRLAGELVAELNRTPGVRDVESDERPGKEQIEIRIDYSRLARLGLTAADVAQTARIAYDGEVVTRVRADEEDVDFRVLLEERARGSEETLRNLAIPNEANRLIPLHQAARLESRPGPGTIRHFNGERTTTVEADLDQAVTSPLEATNRVLARFPDLEQRYPQLRVRVSGEAEETEESISGLMGAFVLAIVGIYFLLALQFNSYTQPLLVMLSIPFGLTGVVIAFALHGQDFSFLAMLGVVGMLGVVVNDSIVLVSHLNDLRRLHPDEPLHQLIAEGTSHRLRAIMLTSLTTVAGLLPLAYGLGGRDLFMQPMALALAYGVLFASPLNLVLIPSMYAISCDLSRKSRRERRERRRARRRERKRGRKSAQEQKVEGS